MPPKKNVDKTIATKTTGKTPRCRKKKENTVLKTPSIVKCEISKRKTSGM